MTIQQPIEIKSNPRISVAPMMDWTSEILFIF